MGFKRAKRTFDDKGGCASRIGFAHAGRVGHPAGILKRALGVGVALLLAAAALPQTAWATTQANTIAAQQNLAISGANDWQIVSGGYQGNTPENKTLSTDGNVRIQKNVVPTGRENVFQVYLSVDKKETSFLNAASFGVKNNLGGISPSSVGTVASINGQFGYGNQYSAWVKVDLYKGDNFLYSWVGQIGLDGTVAEKGGAKVIFATNGELGNKGGKALVLWVAPTGDEGIDVADCNNSSSTNPIELGRVDVSNAEVSSMFEVNEVNVELGAVTDVLGDYLVKKAEIFSADGTAEYDSGTNSVTWNITEKGAPEVVESNDGETWYNNVAELVYQVELDVQKNGFVSTGLDSSGNVNHIEKPGDSYEENSGAWAAKGYYPTNKSASLSYFVTSVEVKDGQITSTLNEKREAIFDSPFVRGLLYDLKLQKVDEEGKPLAGAKFKLTDADGNEVCAETEVGKDGMLEFFGLPHGDYVLVETKTPDGYELPEDNEGGKTSVTLCYTTQAKNGTCCNVSHAKELAACDVHANNAVTKDAVEITNIRATVDYTLPIFKVIDGREWQEGDSFTFKIEGVGRYVDPDGTIDTAYDMPLPMCNGVETNTATINYESKASELLPGTKVGQFCPITFSEPGYYVYKVTEVASEVDSDLVYDDPWYVRIEISDNIAEGGLGETGMWISRDEKAWSVTRGVAANLVFTNRYVSLTFSGLQETKQVIGHDADAGDFTFTVQAKDEAAANLANLDGLTGSLYNASYDPTTHTLTFKNGSRITVSSENATTVRSANQLKLTAANVGESYVYTYKEVVGENSPWHQQQEAEWRVTVAVSWVDEETKDAIKADLKLEKSTDGGQNWQDAGTKTYTSNDESASAPLTVSFVNEYGSTLQIIKTDQDSKPLAGATFTVTCNDPAYDQTATTALNSDKTVAAATFEHIPDGIYTISEAAPEGYQKIADMTLEVKGSSATLKWAGTNQTVGAGTITKQDGVFTITIENYVNPILPTTGSSGTLIMSTFGVTAALLGGVYLASKRLHICK